MRRHWMDVGRVLAVWWLGLTLATPVQGQQLRGSIGMETRVFTNGPAFPGQGDFVASPSLILEPELVWENPRGTFQARAAPFLRLDAHDARRTHADVREAGIRLLADGWTLFAGVGKVFWGKAEAHHLVDIVNQTDLVERLDGEAKLGQPMLNATVERDWGGIDLFLLPYARERTFPDADGRLRGQLPVLDRADYEAASGRWHPDVAARWSYYAGEVDLAVSAFRGTSREPVFMLEGDAGQQALRPYYALVNQLSVDAQWTRGATLWKVEALTRGGHGDRFAATVAGLEHTFFGVGQSPQDLGVLAEVMLDGRGPEAPPTIFDHDVFAGIRWAWNDVADTSILAGPMIDYRTGETVSRVEATRRVGDRWVAEVEVNWIAWTDRGSPLHGLRRDDTLTLRLQRYF